MPANTPHRRRSIRRASLSALVLLFLISPATPSFSQALPDLRVDMQRPADPLFAPGREIVYEVYYINQALAAADDIVLNVDLPEHTTIVSVRFFPYDGMCPFEVPGPPPPLAPNCWALAQMTSEKVTAYKDRLSSFENGAIYITVRINDGAPIGASVSVEAAILCLAPSDSNESNNTVTINETVVTPVTTTAVTGVAYDGAWSGGDIVPETGYAVLARGVCWSPTPNPSVAGSRTDDGSGAGPFTSSMTGLNPNTTHYVRAYATYAGITLYGDERTFLTGNLNVQKAGEGTGLITSDPAGIDCGLACGVNLGQDTNVTLTAAPDPGSAFDGWTGGPAETCAGSGPCKLTLDRPYSIVAVFNPDSDGDGVGDVVEDAGPNGGDGNYDGFPDSGQPDVVTLRNVKGAWTTLISPDGTTLSGVHATTNPEPEGLPGHVQCHCGSFGFTINGLAAGTDAIVLMIPHGYPMIVNDYYKYGPSPDDPTDHWYGFLWDGATGVQVIEEEGRTAVMLRFVDGRRGDDDLAANGRITDLGAPAYNPENTGGGSGGCFISTDK